MTGKYFYKVILGGVKIIHYTGTRLTYTSKGWKAELTFMLVIYIDIRGQSPIQVDIVITW